MSFRKSTDCSGNIGGVPEGMKGVSWAVKRSLIAFLKVE